MAKLKNIAIYRRVEAGIRKGLILPARNFNAVRQGLRRRGFRCVVDKKTETRVRFSVVNRE